MVVAAGVPFERVRSDELREKIMFSLGQMRGEGNGEWLLGIVADKRYSIDTRKSALFNAGQNRVPAADLVNLYGRLEEREMKEQLIWVMHERRDPAAIDKLIDIAKKDTDPQVRRTAINLLGRSNNERAKQFLKEFWER